MLKSTSFVVISALLAAPSFAAGPTPTPTDPVIVDPAPYVAPSADWTGGYVGGSLLGGRLDQGLGTSDTRGFGVHAGYLRDFGSFVAGGELAYADGEATSSGFSGDVSSTRLKAVGGYDAGAFMPYATLGVSQMEGNGLSDNAMLYGVGVKYAFNSSWTTGLEYIVESKDNFDDSGFDVENRELALRIDYRF
jgi:outer membrane immunogenic protein